MTNNNNCQCHNCRVFPHTHTWRARPVPEYLREWIDSDDPADYVQVWCDGCGAVQ